MLIQHARFASLIPLLLAALLPLSAIAAPGAEKSALPAFAKAAADEPTVVADLLSDQTAIVPGQPLTVGVRLKLADSWHVYWKNPGASGLPVEIAWKLPAGFSAGEIQWPVPIRFELDGMINFGYEHEVVLLVDLNTPANLAPDAKIELAASVNWLACADLCVPGSADVKLSLPVAGTRTPAPSRGDALAKARAVLPAKIEGWRVAAQHEAGGVTLRLKGPGAEEVINGGEVYFYPEAVNTFAAPPKQEVRGTADEITIALKPAVATDLNPTVESPSKLASLKGVLVSSKPLDKAGRRSMVVDVDLTGVAAPPSANAAAGEAESGLLFFLLLAYLGGLILNLMPCVFPVLSLKILGFVQQAGEDRRVVRKHGFLFGAGVLMSFWALAGLLLALRAGSQEIGGGASEGWGFQMQNPTFVLGMILLMFTIGLNLAGVFEIGVGLTAVAGNLEGKSQGYAKSFFSGVLATLIATPCTAPFMGAALGWALSQPAASAMLVFTALGLGMATPYVLLSCLPQLLRFLPRPGAWMESFKQFMAFPMFATVAWLAWVYVTITSEEQVMRLLLGLTLFAMGAWWYGRWSLPRRRPAVRWVARIGAAGCVVLAVLLSMEPAESQVKWEPFSEDRLAELRAEGRPVLIDFTASWCITCQANKQSSLRTAAAEKLYLKHNVAVLVADWSRKDSRTLKILQQYGRAGVPLYLVFPKDPSGDPEVLPNLLTPGIVEDAIERATGGAVAAGG